MSKSELSVFTSRRKQSIPKNSYKNLTFGQPSFLTIKFFNNINVLIFVVNIFPSDSVIPSSSSLEKIIKIRSPQDAVVLNNKKSSHGYYWNALILILTKGEKPKPEKCTRAKETPNG